ncbi:hypothetical protein BDR05DRAFT_1004698 [Suillus weaverae]|nr:hypothetical protein BDR05DRAFT_1004698 [Suillus weaverae]
MDGETATIPPDTQKPRIKHFCSKRTEKHSCLHYGLSPKVWFLGAHSDVGGGYKCHELQDIALFWMEANPEPWGTSQPHNAYMESNYVTRIVVGHKNHLKSKQITTTSVFHQSLEFSPQNLVSPNYMVTTSITQKEFGLDFIWTILL